MIILILENSVRSNQNGRICEIGYLNNFRFISRQTISP